MTNLETLRIYRQKLLAWRGSIDPKTIKKELEQVRKDISYYIKLKKRNRKKVIKLKNNKYIIGYE